MIRVSTAQLEQQKIIELENSEGPEFLQLAEDDIYTADTTVDYVLKAEKISGGMHVSGRVATIVKGNCSRCLKETQCKVENDEIELFFPYTTEEIIDISDDIREELLLNLPMNIICKENCAGLCPRCGADLNNTQCSCTGEESTENDSTEDDTPGPWAALDAWSEKK